ncbi:MAG: hypothetical protein RL391_217 [Actinomycetota bacterium]
MHVIVVGCGRVGSTVARSLSKEGHSVVVVDRRPSAFRRLGEDFVGDTVAGIGFDRTVLQSARIAEAAAVLAVTNGDNSNILIARVAREMYGIEKVVARIYDPQRAAIYQRLGISTVATVSWASGQILSLLAPDSSKVLWSDPSSTFVLVERRVGATTAGRALADLESSGGRVALLTRHGEARLPVATSLLQEGDIVQVMVSTGALSAVDEFFGSSEGGHP